jgi:hypothetical protein
MQYGEIAVLVNLQDAVFKSLSARCFMKKV